MKVDIFPALNLPVIYVCQPYGGMDPQQMEGLIANYYEYHFLYINGIHHVEIEEHPGRVADEALLPPRHGHGPGHGRDGGVRQPLAGIHAAGDGQPVHHAVRHRQRAGRLSRALERDQDIGQIQDQALFKVRPMFAAIEGVSAPPPFGGSQRTVVVRADPQRLLAYGLSADDVVQALSAGNTIAPPARFRDATRMPLVPTNAMVVKPEELGNIEVKPGVFLRDVVLPRPGHRQAADRGRQRHPHRLRPGQRQAGRLHPRHQAGQRHTLDVVNNVRANLPKMQDVLPDDIKVSFEFDQSPYVTNSMKGAGIRGAGRGRAGRADGAGVPARLAFA